MSIIDSLKRLERVGDETSIVTQKLKKSANEVADKILRTIEKSEVIDRPTYYDNFKVVELPFLIKKENDTTWVNNEEEIPEGYRSVNRLVILYDLNDGMKFSYESNIAAAENMDSPNSINISRWTALHFSELINAGFIDKISDWIEIRKKNNEKSIEKLEVNKK